MSYHELYRKLTMLKRIQIERELAGYRNQYQNETQLNNAISSTISEMETDIDDDLGPEMTDWSVPKKYADYFDAETIPAQVLQRFEKNGHALISPTISVQEEGVKWQITCDNGEEEVDDKRKYNLIRVDNKIIVYTNESPEVKSKRKVELKKRLENLDPQHLWDI